MSNLVVYSYYFLLSLQRYNNISEQTFEKHIFYYIFNKLCNSEYVFRNNEKSICPFPRPES